MTFPALTPVDAPVMTVISAVDPALLDLAELALTGCGARVFSAQLRLEPTLEFALTESPWGDGGDADFDAQPQTECVTCGLRGALGELARRTLRVPGDSVIVLLPACVELAHLCPGLQEELAGIGVCLTRAAHLLDADRAREQLLRHEQLSELPQGDVDFSQFGRSALLAADAERCAAEVHLTNLAYADAAVVVGSSERGVELIEHLQSLEGMLVPGLSELEPRVLLGRAHDCEQSLQRAHPVTLSAGGGRTHSGTWTLDLHGDRPFHPERLRQVAEQLGQVGCVVRGCFWLPSRPTEALVWESIGGVVSVGSAGSWRDLDAPARTHLVVTGVGDEGCKASFERAFADALLRPEEMASALAWDGKQDGLDDWFSEV